MKLSAKVLNLSRVASTHKRKVGLERSKLFVFSQTAWPTIKNF